MIFDEEEIDKTEEIEETKEDINEIYEEKIKSISRDLSERIQTGEISKKEADIEFEERVKKTNDEILSEDEISLD